MQNTVPLCPSCRSSELRLIGCVLLGPEGVPLSGATTQTLLNNPDFAITRELVRCVTCNQRSTLDDARKAAELATDNVLWENTEHNLKRPIVCHKCGNKEHFIRRVVKSVEELEVIAVDNGVPQVVDIGGDPEITNAITLKYTCAVDNCGGEIPLFTATYTLAREI